MSVKPPVLNFTGGKNSQSKLAKHSQPAKLQEKEIIFHTDSSIHRVLITDTPLRMRSNDATASKNV